MSEQILKQAQRSKELIAKKTKGILTKGFKEGRDATKHAFSLGKDIPEVYMLQKPWEALKYPKDILELIASQSNGQFECCDAKKDRDRVYKSFTFKKRIALREQELFENKDAQEGEWEKMEGFKEEKKVITTKPRKPAKEGGNDEMVRKFKKYREHYLEKRVFREKQRKKNEEIKANFEKNEVKDSGWR